MKKFIILIPVYNDWESVFKLLENIDDQIKDWDAEISVLIVNDASTDDRPKTELDLKNIKFLKVINMTLLILIIGFLAEVTYAHIHSRQFIQYPFPSSRRSKLPTQP